MKAQHLTSEIRVGEMAQQEAVQSLVHDLRTPIAVVQANIQLVLSGMLGSMEKEQRQLLERSITSLLDMYQMTENLLQSSRLDAGELVMQPSIIDLDQLLAETIQLYEVPFRQRQMQLHRNGNTLGLSLYADPFWIKRVVQNLVWNAYKYTPDKGDVRLHVRHAGDGVEMVVEDNGRGVSAGQLCRLFEKFGQSKKEDRTLGTGLGLWICRRIMELHGGSVRCESEPNQGSRFILSFPSSCIL